MTAPIVAIPQFSQHHRDFTIPIRASPTRLPQPCSVHGLFCTSSRHDSTLRALILASSPLKRNNGFSSTLNRFFGSEACLDSLVKTCHFRIDAPNTHNSSEHRVLELHHPHPNSRIVTATPPFRLGKLLQGRFANEEIGTIFRMRVGPLFATWCAREAVLLACASLCSTSAYSETAKLFSALLLSTLDPLGGW